MGCPTVNLSVSGYTQFGTALIVILYPFSLLASPPLPSSELFSWLSPLRRPLCGGPKSVGRSMEALLSQNASVLLSTSAASEYLPIGLGAQLGRPMLESSAVEAVGEAGG